MQSYSMYVYTRIVHVNTNLYGLSVSVHVGEGGGMGIPGWREGDGTRGWREGDGTRGWREGDGTRGWREGDGT